MDYEHRIPQFRISIVRPQYSSTVYLEDSVATFDANDENKPLLSYNYEMSLAAFESPFSLLFAPVLLDKSGNTVMDLLKPMDVVKIEEHGELKYVGIIESTRYSARMTDAGPDRTIAVQGYGIGGILDRFAILLDQVVLSNATTTIEAIRIKYQALLQDISAKYGENTTISTILNNIKKSFKETMEKVGGYTPGTGVFNLMEQYLSITEQTATKTKYPVALSIFSYGGITLGQAFREIVVPPFYEIFSRWENEAGKWILNIRPTPYSPATWMALPKTVINPLHVTAFDCGFSSTDVKTFFFAFLSGGVNSFEQSRAMYQATAIKKDSEKWAIYGYRPLEASFRYAWLDKLEKNGRKISLMATRPGDPNANAVETISDEKLMDEYSSILQKWFGRADELLSGSLDMMTVKNGPRIGERISFNDTEFYVESLAGNWTYGEKMVTVLKITRGGRYNPSFITGTGPNGEDAETTGNWWFKRGEKLGNRLELQKVTL